MNSIMRKYCQSRQQEQDNLIMKKINLKRLKQLLNACEHKKIAVIGDVMLDRYIWGRVSRISPEAPVPVVEVSEESMRIGGAGNVANNILSLHGNPLLFGIIGDDAAGKDVLSRLESKGLDTSCIVPDQDRPTTMKTRIIAHSQHVVRADFESKDDIPGDIENRLIKLLEEKIGDIQGIIIEDYNKGVVTKSLINKVMNIALENHCPVAVDPKFNNFFEYQNVTVFKPNLNETQNALGFMLDSDERIDLAGKMLLDRLKCEHVLITRGKEGLSLYSRNGFIGRVYTKARKIADVSGAGDTVIGTLSMIIAAGGDILEAATIANHAAGTVVAEVGIVPVKPEKIIESFQNDS